MAVASGRASLVLAQPLFHRLNVHVRTLNTREVVRVRTGKLSRLGKRVAQHRANFVTLLYDFQPFLTATKPVLPPCGTCAQLR